jgi:RNA polymerase sigma-70 factor, ECF subfamily
MTTSRVGWPDDSSTGRDDSFDPLVVDDEVDTAADAPADTAFEAFFRRTYADTVRTLVRSGVDPESAADCAQEAYVKAYTRWWRLRRYDDPSAWVRKVATNRAIDLFRKRGRHHKALPALTAEAEAKAAVPAEEPDSMTEYAALLPEQQRRVVELCYGRDLTAEQAAAEMGISAGAVRFHLSRARTRLRPAVDADRRDEEVS